MMFFRHLAFICNAEEVGTGEAGFLSILEEFPEDLRSELIGFASESAHGIKVLVVSQLVSVCQNIRSQDQNLSGVARFLRTGGSVVQIQRLQEASILVDKAVDQFRMAGNAIIRSAGILDMDAVCPLAVT